MEGLPGQGSNGRSEASWVEKKLCLHQVLRGFEHETFNEKEKARRIEKEEQTANKRV